MAGSSGPSAQQDQELFKSLTNCLQEVEAKRSKVGSALCTADDSQADLIASSSETGGSEACGGPVGTMYTGLVAGNESTGNDKLPKKRLNGLVQDHSVASAQVSIMETQSLVPPEQLKTGNKKSSTKNKRKKRVANSTTDSCDSSITSFDAAKKTHSSLKVPKEPPNLGSQKRGKSHKSKQLVNLESSSISSASPSSSVCSQSPLTLSPSPTFSVSSGNRTLCKLLASGSNLNTREDVGRKTSEGKDEWPDLDMEYNNVPPKCPGSGVHRHLDVEAKSLELSPEYAEKEDSGCNMSVGSSNESCAGGVKLQLLEQPPATVMAPYPSVSNGNCYAGEVLSPQFSEHLQSQQYLWMQSQQLNMFVQQHKEQQEQQTDKHIFYPVDPVLEPPAPCLPQHVTPGLIQTPFFQHVPLSPPHNPHDPRPLFFPVQSSHDPQVPGQLSDLPHPPPPPPLPVHPYHPPTGNKWADSKGEEEQLVYPLSPTQCTTQCTPIVPIWCIPYLHSPTTIPS